MPRLLLVSNRLPVTVLPEGRAVPSAGGLATGLRGPHQQMDGLWFGWPGDVSGLDPATLARVEAELAELRTVPIHLRPSEIRRYYDGFANGVLWPLFHYLLERLPLSTRNFEPYLRVNERFAAAVAAHYRPGDLIWVHDYQLMLVPQLLRQLLPDAVIGFFLHIPFPSHEVFRLLPWREALLRGLLGADLIGFHTPSYLRHFATSLVRLLGTEVDVTSLWHEGRRVELGVFPMGVDSAAFSARAADPTLLGDVAALRRRHGDARLFLGIDRLDYTKGIPRRLLSFERLLQQSPGLATQVNLVQVAVPTRDQVSAYQDYRRTVDEMVGRINGAFSTLHSVPVHYLHRSFTEREVITLYRGADVMLVTPLRDGMNLVAKEFISCRNDEDGVLVLSEFAGAATQLPEALIVNPYDIEGVAATMQVALSLSREERGQRMRRLRERVATADVHHWARRFIDDLTRIGQRPPRATQQIDLPQLIAELRAAPRLALLLDYDGTLVPLSPHPERATPDDELLALLDALARRPRTEVHVVSGRSRRSLEAWLGALPIGLQAEHGLWWRGLDGVWHRDQRPLRAEWLPRVRPLLDDFVRQTPGTFVEEKEAALVWHYRQADVEFGAMQAKELRLHLLELLSNLPVQILPGDKIVEVRTFGVNKGLLVDRLFGADPPQILALGDDRTDEDLFAALPNGAVGGPVGEGPPRAGRRLPDVAAVRRLLRGLLD